MTDGNDPFRDFAGDGVAGPVPVLAASQCRLIMSAFAAGHLKEPKDWNKGWAASEPLIFEIASHPDLVAEVERILGPNVILWGARFAGLQPGAQHPWHCDIECFGAPGPFLSVWIGLENAGAETGLKFVRGSHRYPKSLQQAQAEHGFRRGQACDDDVLGWARALGPDATLVRPALTTGEAIFFDGRIWHCSANSTAKQRRMTLLLQYARGDQSVFIPDLDRLEWPWDYRADLRPPVVAIRGSADPEANRIVPRPRLRARDGKVTHFVRSLELPLGRDPDTGWKPHFQFSGEVPAAPQMGVHVSVLDPGKCPHPPHVHIQEELLMVLDGTAEIVIADAPDDPDPRREQLQPGDFAYYPAYRHHTIRNTADAPVTYLMFKWRGAPRDTARPLAATVVRPAEKPPPENPKPFDPKLLFQGPTAYLRKLHAHVTDLQPGAGYAAHADAYDVAIVLLSGEIETVGERLRAPAITYHAAGSLHGMRNPGRTVARYVVFELHDEGAARRAAAGPPKPPPQDAGEPHPRRSTVLGRAAGMLAGLLARSKGRGA